MKRLLAYLFIFLGLGSVVNVNAAVIGNTEYFNLFFCEKITHSKKELIFQSLDIGALIAKLDDNCPDGFKTHSDSRYFTKTIQWTQNNITPRPIKPVLCYDGKSLSVDDVNCNGANFKTIKYDGKNFYIDDKQETQIAKKEPSQTQEVVEKKVVCVPKNKKRFTYTPIGIPCSRGYVTVTQTQIAKKEPVKEKKIETKKIATKNFKLKEIENCAADTKNNILQFLEEGRLTKKYCLKSADISLLGDYRPLQNFPEGMYKILNTGCISEICNYKKASSKMYEIFVRRTGQYHARHPGAMIHGMAWYELMYWGNLKKTQKAINTYLKYGPNNYPAHLKFFKSTHEAAIASLIKMNNGRKNMREAMGMSINDDVETVIRKHWVLGDFLNNDKLKVKKVVMDPDIKKRKLLLEKYQGALKRYKAKLEEERNKKKS